MFKNFYRPKWMRQYHRWLGVAVALPWLWLAITGLILRQQETWSLNTRKIYSESLLKHYGVFPTEESRSVSVAGAKGQVVTLWGGNLYKDGNPLGEADSLIGATAAGAYLAVATESEILIYDMNLTLFDSLDELTLGVSSLERIAVGGQNTPVLFTSEGQDYALDKDYLEAKEITITEIPNAEFSREATVSAETMQTIKQYYAQDVGIPYSRLILDLHSGNFFGTMGKVVIDLSAFLSIILTILGLLLVKKKWKRADKVSGPPTSPE